MDNGLLIFVSLVSLTISLLVIYWIYSIYQNTKYTKNYLYVIMRLLGDKKGDDITKEELQNLYKKSLEN
jgi:hypothetical protein